MIRQMLSMPWTVLSAAACGFLLAPAGQTGWRAALDAYDEARPVITATVDNSVRDGDAVLIGISVTKLRTCRYLRMQAYTRSADGALSDAYASRVDMPSKGDSKPPGRFSIGQWRVWPLANSEAVLMFVQHDCDGRIVQSKLAEVVL